MDALQQAFGCELAQVAANRVFGESQFFTEIFGDDLAGLAKYLEEMLFALGCEHSPHYRIVGATDCMKVHDIAHFCAFC